MYAFAQWTLLTLYIVEIAPEAPEVFLFLFDRVAYC